MIKMEEYFNNNIINQNEYIDKNNIQTKCNNMITWLFTIDETQFKDEFTLSRGYVVAYLKSCSDHKTIGLFMGLIRILIENQKKYNEQQSQIPQAENKTTLSTDIIKTIYNPKTELTELTSIDTNNLTENNKKIVERAINKLKVKNASIYIYDNATRNEIKYESKYQKTKNNINNINTEKSNYPTTFDFLKYYDDLKLLNTDLFSKLISLTLNPEKFCNLWYQNSQTKNYSPYKFINSMLNAFFIKTYDKIYVSQVENNNKSIIDRDTKIFKALFIQNLISYYEYYIEQNKTHININYITDFLYTHIKDKITEINKSKDRYIFSYKLLKSVIELYDLKKNNLSNLINNDFNNTNQNFEIILELNYYNELLTKSIDKIKVIDNLFKSQKIYEINKIIIKDDIDIKIEDKPEGNTTQSNVSSLPPINSSISDKIDYTNIINFSYLNMIMENAQILTYVKERNDTMNLESKYLSNPRYDIEVLEETYENNKLKTTKINDKTVTTQNAKQINYYDFNIGYFNYPNRLGFKDKSEIYSQYEHNKAQKTVNYNKELREDYSLGKINRYYNYEITAEQMVNDVEFGNVLYDKLCRFENIIIIGIGQSGAGKTSALIGLKTKIRDQEINQPGVLPLMAKRLINEFDYNGKKQTFTSATIKLINLYVNISDDLNKNEDIKIKHYFPSNIKIQGASINGYSFTVNNGIWKTSNEQTIDDIINKAFDVREEFPTKNNPDSSRSHIIACVTFKTDDNNESKIVICDLAGVEDRFKCELADLLILDRNYKNSKKHKNNMQLDSHFDNDTNTEIVANRNKIVKELQTYIDKIEDYDNIIKEKYTQQIQNYKQQQNEGHYINQFIQLINSSYTNYINYLPELSQLGGSKLDYKQTSIDKITNINIRESSKTNEKIINGLKTDIDKLLNKDIPFFKDIEFNDTYIDNEILTQINNKYKELLAYQKTAAEQQKTEINECKKEFINDIIKKEMYKFKLNLILSNNDLKNDDYTNSSFLNSLNPNNSLKNTINKKINEIKNKYNFNDPMFNTEIDKYKNMNFHQITISSTSKFFSSSNEEKKFFFNTDEFNDLFNNTATIDRGVLIFSLKDSSNNNILIVTRTGSKTSPYKIEGTHGNFSTYISNKINKLNQEIEELKTKIINCEKQSNDTNTNTFDRGLKELMKQLQDKFIENYKKAYLEHGQQEYDKYLNSKEKTTTVTQLKQLVYSLIRFCQLEFNCKIRRQEGIMINTTLKEMQKFIGKLLFKSAKSRFNNILIDNNLLQFDNNDIYDCNDIKKKLKKYNDSLIDIVDMMSNIVSFKSNNQDTAANTEYDKLVKKVPDLKKHILKLFNFILYLIDKYSFSGNNRVFSYKNYYNLPYILINICIVDYLLSLFDIKERINFEIILFGLKNMNSQLYLNELTNLLDKQECSTTGQEYLKYTSYRLKEGATYVDDINKIDQYDDVKCVLINKFTTYASDKQIKYVVEVDNIEEITNLPKDNTTNYENIIKFIKTKVISYNNNTIKFYDDYINSTRSKIDDLPSPLLYTSPTIQKCNDKKKIYENEYDKFYSFDDKTNNELEYIFKIMTEKEVSNVSSNNKLPSSNNQDNKLEGFNINMDKSTIVIFTVINTTSDKVAPTNNPPTPPFININKLKLLYKLLSHNKQITKEHKLIGIDNILTNSQQHIIKTMLNNFYDLLILYDFYNISKSQIVPLREQQNINNSLLKDLKNIIEFIESNNATTLIGTVDFDRFTKIRDPNNFYMICDDNDDNIMMDSINEANINTVINGFDDYNKILDKKIETILYMNNNNLYKEINITNISDNIKYLITSFNTDLNQATAENKTVTYNVIDNLKKPDINKLMEYLYNLGRIVKYNKNNIEKIGSSEKETVNKSIPIFKLLKLLNKAKFKITNSVNDNINNKNTLLTENELTTIDELVKNIGTNNVYYFITYKYFVINHVEKLLPNPSVDTSVNVKQTEASSLKRSSSSLNSSNSTDVIGLRDIGVSVNL